MRRSRDEIDAEKAQKPRPDLVPGTALEAMGRVLAYGYAKHGKCTWREAGTEQARAETHIASAFRHIAAMGDDYDALDESGLPHLHHALSQLAIAVDCKARESAMFEEATNPEIPAGYSLCLDDRGPDRWWDIRCGDKFVGARGTRAEAVRRAWELAAPRSSTTSTGHEVGDVAR